MATPKRARSASELQTLVTSARSLLDLELRWELAEEALRVVEEAGAQARAEATARERRARGACQILAERLKQARDASAQLRAEAQAGGRWDEALEVLRAAQAAYRDARRAGRNTEYLEASLDLAETRLDVIEQELRST